MLPLFSISQTYLNALGLGFVVIVLFTVLAIHWRIRIRSLGRQILGLQSDSVQSRQIAQAEQLLLCREAAVTAWQEMYLFCLKAFNDMDAVLTRSEMQESDFAMYEQAKADMEEKGEHLFRLQRELLFVNTHKSLPLEKMLEAFQLWQNESWLRLHARIELGPRLHMPVPVQALLLYALISLINTSRTETHAIEVWLDISYQDDELRIHYYDPVAGPGTFSHAELQELVACLNPSFLLSTDEPAFFLPISAAVAGIAEMQQETQNSY